MSKCPCGKELAVHIAIPDLVQIIQGYVHHLTDAATFHLCANIDLHIVCARVKQKKKREQKKKPPSKYPIFIGPDAREFCMLKKPTKNKDNKKYASIRVGNSGPFTCLSMTWHSVHTYNRYTYMDTTIATDPELFNHRCVFSDLLPENRLLSISSLQRVCRDEAYEYPAIIDVPKEFDIACQQMQDAIFQARVDAGLWNTMHGCD